MNCTSIKLKNRREKGFWSVTESRNSETARGRDIQGKVHGRGMKAPPWSECTVLLEPPSVQSSPNPILLGFYEASFHRHVWFICDWFSPQPHSLSWRSGVELKVLTLLSRSVLTTSSHPEVFSKSHLSNMSPVVVERGSLGVTGHTFPFYDSKEFSGTGHKTKYYSKRFPICLIIESLRILGAVGQELWMKTKCIFLTDHNIGGT